MTPIEQWKALKARCNRRKLEQVVFTVMDMNIECGSRLNGNLMNEFTTEFAASVANVYDNLPAYERPEPTN